MCLFIVINALDRFKERLSNVEPLTKSIKYDADLNPLIIEPDPLASDEEIDVFALHDQLILTRAEDDIMNSEDEPLSGLNGRLRPRKSAAPSPQTPKPIRKPESKPALDRPKRTSTPSKAVPTKPDDLANKSDLSTAPQLLCPYCDRKFASKQTISKHARRIHLSNPKQDTFIDCLFCNHSEAEPTDIIRHMVNNHPNQYFACLDCHTRFPSTSELAEHKLNVCEKQKEKPYRSKLRQKVPSGSKKSQKTLKLAEDKDFTNNKDFSDGHCFNGVVISCELKPSQVNDEADIEDNITTNLILPTNKNLGPNTVIEKNAVIVLDDIQWNKRMPPNFSFHNTDADQILSRLGVVHRSPRTGESTKKDWFRNSEEPVQKFEKCFETSFYSKVASNVHENLAKFLDGSFNFNPDPDSVIKTRKSKQSVVINAAEGFPILLAFEQYSRNVFDGYMPRTLAPKHKWKWENDRNSLLPDDIKRDTHVDNCIITLVSSLDIWTQLCMRRKFEQKFSIPPLEKKTEKQNTISKELKEILESRELPTSSQQVMKYISKPTPTGDNLDFPLSLGLKPSTSSYDMQPAILSGEWVRPRCYVCCACGAQTRDSRALSSHISTQHPNAQVQHYEIVGELLLNADILKHLYVPPSQMCNRTRPLRGFRECTKCRKSISLEDLHQHMLDCAGDTPAVRRKCRYRPFGVRRRRPRLPDNTIRKKIRKDIRSRQTRQKTHMRPRPKIRSEVGDAETIRKMLADLPAKRHRVMVNPMNPSLRPRRKLDKQRNKIIMKRRSSEIARNRKQRDMKKVIDSNPSGSNAGDNDDNDNKSDDENKPLKPKMKRVLTHPSRQSESLKRKVALNRAKRRAKMKEHRANKDLAEQSQPAKITDGSGTSGQQGDQLSIDNSPQRIDVNGGPYGTREQSSSGSRSNNRDSRDDQSPGSNGNQNGNQNNSFNSMHNVPLKHSIARLTAETDVHDRSMQYHHLYLMQPPECAEIDISQHVPSGQQRVFENEAVVTKLDKPPLHFNLRSPIDAYAYHRNKLPKPKKGLNDCIAMLKNKLVDPIPTTKMSHSVQCGNDDRLDSETIISNQRSTVDFELNTHSRPAEIFSRHQLIPERYMEYPNDPGLIAQNFAELPFHFLPTQRIAYDLPPPDNRIDPRYMKTAKQKQNEGQNKRETRRRSARADKNLVKKQDILTSPVAYPVNISTPSKVNAVQGRRASSQSVSVNTTAAAAAKRRASVSYNRSNTLRNLNDYETMMAQPRVLDYIHNISPEAHLMEVSHPETYTQAQINKQNQMIAEQMMMDSYINKKQLAICVDSNYTNKMLTAAFADSMYSNSKNSSISPGNNSRKGKLAPISPGNRFDNGKPASISPGNKYDHNLASISPGNMYDGKHLSVSPRNRYDSKNSSVSPGSRYDNSKQLSISPGTKYDYIENTTISPGSRYDSNKHVMVSPGSGYDNSKHLAISPGRKLDNSTHLIVSPGSSYNLPINAGNMYDNSKLLAISIENSKHTAISPGSNNKRASNSYEGRYDHNITPEYSPGNRYDNANLIAISPGSRNDINKHISVSPGSKYDNTNQVTINPEALYDICKQATASSGSPYNNNHPMVANKSGSISPGTNYISKKQAAVAADNNYNKHVGTPMESHIKNQNQTINTDGNNYQKVQTVINTERVFEKPYVVNADGNLLTKAQNAYAEGVFITKKAQAAVENKLANMSQNISTENNITAKTSTLTHIDTNNQNNDSQALIRGESNYDNTHVLDCNKDAIKANKQSSAEENLKAKPHTAVSIDCNYPDKSHAMSPENDYINKKQIVSESYGSKQPSQLSENNFINKKITDVLTERNSTSRKMSVEYYTANVYVPAPITTAYVGSNYKPLHSVIEAPLDLSKTTSNENTAILKADDNPYVSDNEENYETLDLSHKSSVPDHEDVVVDLSVKNSTSDLDVRSKIRSVKNKLNSATDLSRKMCEIRDTPTDLTVKRKSDGNECDDSGKKSDHSNQKLTQDLTGKKNSSEKDVTIMSIKTHSVIPTDLSGKSQDISKSVVAHCKNALREDTTENATIGGLPNSPTHCSSNDKEMMNLNETHDLDDSLSTEDPNVEKQNSFEKCLQHKSILDPSVVPKAVLDTTLRTQYELHASASTSKPSLFVDERSRSPQRHTVEMNDTNFDNDVFSNSGAAITRTCESTLLISTTAAPTPLYTLSNTVVPVAMSKYESTTPVYTLANACISMAKVEPSIIAPLTEAILSIQSTTIASVAPVYTLTDTTVNPSMNYMHISNKPGQDLPSPTCVTPIETVNTEVKNIYISPSSPPPVSNMMDDQAKKTDNSANYCDFDPETAKKIAMLPKELVEILGTMPVDHRNQLLNVLPQYVSTSVPPSQNETPDISATSFVNRAVSPTRISDFDVKPSIGYSPVSSSQTMRPATSIVSCIERFDETKSFPIYQPDPVCKPLDREVAKFEPPDQIPKVYEIDGNTVIDLTEDDIPLNSEAVKIIEETNNDVSKIDQPISIAPNTKSIKQKVNDQTASLRAVRIKTPSERKKSVCIETTPLKIPTNEQVKSKVEVLEDPINSSDFDKTLAIQQAEISSTQHNTTIVGNCKYPLAISPSSTEYSGDESNKPVSQQSPIPAIEIGTQKLAEKKYEKPVPKSGMVSSSICTNEANRNDRVNNLKDVNIPQAVTNTSAVLSTDTESDDLSMEKIISDKTVENHLGTSTVSPLELDEDSDDDISLAAIVKQKQRDQVKFGTTKNDTEKSSGSKKKKKDKKGKKSGKKSQVLLDNNKPSEEITTRIVEMPSIKDHKLKGDAEIERAYCILATDGVDGLCNTNSTTTDSKDTINKHPKKTTKKSRLLNEVEIQKPDKILVESNINVDKDNNGISEVLNKKIGMKAKTAEVIQASNEIEYEEDNEIVNNHIVTQTKATYKANQELTADAIIKISKCDDKVAVSKAKDKKKKLDFSKCEKESDLKFGENTCTTSEIKTIQMLEPPVVTQCNVSEIDSQNVISIDPTGENNFCDIDEVKKGKKFARYKKTKNEDNFKVDLEVVDSSENIAISSEIKDNLPLRRSRRGKSLYLDSTSLEEDPVEFSDITVEQKAPLTKKQLIFSKLLLDEGKPKPAAHSTPQKQDSSGSEGIITENKSLEVSEISDIDQVDEICPEKSKGTKRRINAQFPKKTKKKKSIGELVKSDEIVDSKNSQTENTAENTKSTFEIDKVSSDLNQCLSDDLKNKSSEMNTQEYNSQNNNNNDKHVTSTEKRKNNNQISFDLSQSSKPKKCKMSKSEKKVENDVSDENHKANDSLPVVTSEIKTACYNLPVPARRARSKSVVVKPSSYDPYDIDLEDMVEQNEMFKRKDKNMDHVSKFNKSSSVNEKPDKIVNVDYKVTETNVNISKNDDTEYDKGIVCDSDDSSKSDIPLQKYVEEKEKKIQEVESSLLKEKETKPQANKQKNIEFKESARIHPATEASQNITQTEAEELRSEQFMESFGFFSERKPRKSNLLATKKISETFHITNESDDMYFGFKERTGKKHSTSDGKKIADGENIKSQPQPSTSKKSAPKRGRRQKKTSTKFMPCYCEICKKEFKRSDNYVRHQMSLLHISKLTDGDLKVKAPVHDEPNYLIAYKQYLDRLKKLTDQLAQKKKKYPKAAAKIVLPTLEEILADVNKTVRDQQRCARGLSRDEALFLDCCELLKESHKLGARRFGMSGLDILEKALNEIDTNDNMSDDGDCDSITAQNILESEEVRNLENDLISGLKEAANATRKANMEYQHSLSEFAAPQIVQMVQIEQAQQAAELLESHEDKMIPTTQEIEPEVFNEFSSPNPADSHFEQMEDFELPVKPRSNKPKKHYEVKEKMYPDIQIEDIDMFEDKFDKIKRKCRSQAAAAKQTQPVIDQTLSHNKGRKKSEKKKGKRSSKKTRHQSTHVPTKGALKGFDGIKVSIPTSDINMSAIVPVSESSPKKKKKSSSKKKRDKRDSESSCNKYDSDHRAKESSSKKVDVYEFMDNEDAELFEFRPSTLMERFKSISNNKELPNTSKFNPVAEENSSQGSASDGDDFVYMSDDYVGSDDETENSLLSCEMGNVKVGSEIKKSSPQKRKDAVEKNAVMGKIFKHNAVRAEKKVVVPKETEKPKANLDQLFDSLLEEEPNSSVLNSEAMSPNDDTFTPPKKFTQPNVKSNASGKVYDQTSDSDIFAYPTKSRSSSPGKHEGVLSSTTLSKRRNSSPAKDYVTSSKKRDNISSRKYDLHEVDYGPSTSKNYDSAMDSIDYGPSTSKKYNPMPKDFKKSSPKSYDTLPLQKGDEKSFKNYDTKNKKRNDSSSSKNDDDFNSYDDDLKSPAHKPDEGISTSYDYTAEAYDQSTFEDDPGVARQRARRKCTVGKQNVLAETWSSESEPDLGGPRPNSAESDISGRKKKGRKKEGQQAGGRRGNNRQVAFKKQDVESKVSCSRVSSSGPSVAGGSSLAEDDPGEGPSGLCGASTSSAGAAPAAASASDSAAAAAAAAAAMPAPSTSAVAGPSNAKGRPRSVAYYWSSEGDDEQEHLQQHGWIVGDSHKKLVTMLAHAKGRKRNNDDKRHLVE